MTPREAAKIIGCSPGHVRVLICDGRLKARQINTEWFPFYRYEITRHECERYRDEPQTQGWPRGQSRPKKTKGAKR